MTYRPGNSVPTCASLARRGGFISDHPTPTEKGNMEPEYNDYAAQDRADIIRTAGDVHQTVTTDKCAVETKRKPLIHRAYLVHGLAMCWAGRN